MVRLTLALVCASACALVGRWLPPASLIADVSIAAGGIVSASFLLSWAAEAAQTDISASLATGILALIAVMPEYAVDAWFAYRAGRSPIDAGYAAANLTGSNRLLIGVGWPLVFLVVAAGARRKGELGARRLRLDRRRRLDVVFLGLAGAFSFRIVHAARIDRIDTAVLLAAFVAYVWLLGRQPREEPTLSGVSAALARLPLARRRVSVALTFLIAAATVIALARPFADSLLAAGSALGVNRFLLVQWIAPLASESPELLVAALLAWRSQADAALGTLLSSKVNQWTLLVGSLPIAYRIGGGDGGLPLDGRQTEEILLTAAQTLFGFALLSRLTLRRWHVIALLLLFAVQLALPLRAERVSLAIAYLVGAGAVLLIEQLDRVKRP
jgi:cation:H+ antiporter